MNIKKLNTELQLLIEDEASKSAEYNITDAEKAKLWDMVKDFDEYATKNEFMQEQFLQEALKIECGIELDYNTVQKLNNPNIPNFDINFQLQDKIQWLIDYLDTISQNKIKGFKISNVGTINYQFNNINYTKEFNIPVGKCYKNSTKLVRNAKNAFGVFHMKYGRNHHWNQSCNALLNIPSEFIKPVWTSPSKNNQKYNYVFYSLTGYTYAFGIPYNDKHETILISCY